MWPFGSAEERENEKKQEFVKFLVSEEGRRAVSEALTTEQRARLIKEFEDRLNQVAEIIVSRSAIEIKRSLEKAKFEIRHSLEGAIATLGTYLSSNQGKQILSDLVSDGLARGEFGSFAENARRQFRNLVAEEISKLTTDAKAALERSITNQAAVLRQRAEEAVQEMSERTARDVEQALALYRGVIAEAVAQQLPEVLQDEVARHVRSGPLFSRFRSNHELAAACGISIREVKRLRRRGYFE